MKRTKRLLAAAGLLWLFCGLWIVVQEALAGGSPRLDQGTLRVRRSFVSPNDGHVIDTTGAAMIDAYPNWRSLADSAGNGLGATAFQRAGDNRWAWYWDTMARGNAYHVVWESAGVRTLIAEDWAPEWIAVGDTAIGDSTCFAPSVVTGSILVDGTITAADLGDECVTHDKLYPGAVDDTILADDAVLARHLNETEHFEMAALDVDSLFAHDSTQIVFAETAVFDSSVTIGAYTLPIADGSANQVLKTNGSGILSWQADATGAGGAAYAESLSYGGGTNKDVDDYVNASGLIDTVSVGIDRTGWIAFIQNNQTGGAGMPAADFDDSLAAQGFVNADTTSGPLATYTYITGLGHMAAAAFFDSLDSRDDAYFLTASFDDSLAAQGFPQADSSSTLATRYWSGTQYVLLSAVGDSADAHVTLANIQTATTSDFHNIGGTDDDVPDAGDFGAATDLDANGDVANDSHAHTTTTISGLDISDDTNLTAGDALTLTDDDIDFDGGASPGGELGGTWASPTVDSGIHDDEYVKLSAVRDSVYAAVPQYQTVERQIMLPDSIATAVQFLAINSLSWPNGITIDSLYIQLDSDAAYTLIWQEYSSADPRVYVSVIDSCTTGASDTRAGSPSIDDAAIATDNAVWIVIPVTHAERLTAGMIFH